MAVEVSEGRNSAPWAPLIFSSAAAHTIQFSGVFGAKVRLGSGSRRLCSFCAVLSPRGDGVIPSLCRPPENPPCTQVCGLCLSLSSGGPKERSCKAALGVCVCVFSCPGAASSGQLTSLDNTGMDGIEEEMLVRPEFKHSLLRPLKNTEGSSCLMKFRR